jgi:hypothetical protein
MIMTEAAIAPIPEDEKKLAPEYPMLLQFSL